VTAFLCKLEPRKSWSDLQVSISHNYIEFVEERVELMAVLLDMEEEIPQKYLVNPFENDHGFKLLFEVASSCMSDEPGGVIEQAEKFQKRFINFYAADA